MNRTPLESFLHWEKNAPSRTFLRQPIDGEWYSLTFREAGDQIRKVCQVLRQQLPPSSKVAVLSKNCAEWIMADLAIMMADHISVPIYPSLSASSIAPLLHHSEAKMIIIGKLDDFRRQREAIPPKMIRLSFDRYGVKEGLLWSTIIKTSQPSNVDVSPAADSIATIMYSSGTTGDPKGVMLTHGAFAFVGRLVADQLNIREPERFFSYLPLSHIAERGLMEMVALHCGGCISFTESLEKFQQNLQHERPTIFGGVPRIYMKFQEGVLKKIPQEKLDRLLSIPLIGMFIKKTIRKKLGLDKARVIVSGAAPTPVSLLQWFHSLGLSIREVYGMTENTAYSHGNYQKIKMGTVGQPWKEVECKLADDGEILIRHPALMKGYYKDEETTARVLGEDGFLKTGDKGEIDGESFLTITGRIKDQFKTDKAKFIAPAPIELRILSNSIVEQVCVVGMGLPQPIALINLSSVSSSMTKDDISESLNATLQTVNTQLENYERVEKIVIMREPWSLDNGLLTPSLKLKRSELEKKYLPHYNSWFMHAEPIVWDK